MNDQTENEAGKNEPRHDFHRDSVLGKTGKGFQDIIIAKRNEAQGGGVALR